jgi:uncharacterized protein (TIGR02246 family)
VSDDETAIRALFDEWKAAMARHDLEALIAMTEADAEFWTNGAPAMKGHEVMRATLPVLFARFRLEQDFEYVEVLVGGDLAVVRGVEHNRILPLDGGPPIERDQRAVSILLRRDGRWRFARGITNLPPAPADVAG